MLDEYTIAD
jgi:hypothetical protein